MPPSAESDWIDLCASEALVDGGLAVPFTVRHWGRVCRAFAVRFQGKAVAYLNQCSHVPMEMDYQPNHFFDTTGQWLICATHGALYDPLSGRCVMGPCRGGLVRIALRESQGRVHWHTEPHLQPANDS